MANSRIKRRNYNGFDGIGNCSGYNNNRNYGDYLNKYQNHKATDYTLAKAKKDKLNFVSKQETGIPIIDPITKKVMFRSRDGVRVLNKKYANNRQRFR